MLKSHLWRAVTPAIVTGLLTASALGAVVPTASALDIAPQSLTQTIGQDIGQNIGQDHADHAAGAAPAAEQRPQPLLPGSSSRPSPPPGSSRSWATT